MPYICLARNDIQDGSLQVLDLLPNSSQAIPSLNPPGETRYVNRVKTEIANFDNRGGKLTLATPYVDGLAAYLVDTVEVGGAEQATGTIIILAGLAAGETVSINGITFTAVAGGAVAANREFNDIANSGSIANTVASLVTAITNATAINAVKGGTISGSYAHAVAGSPSIGLYARTGAGATLTGWAGDISLTSVGAHIGLTGVALTRTHPAWTPAVQAAAVGLITANMDAGNPLTLSAINTVLLATAGADLTGSTGASRSYGSVEDVLACLSGRTYRIPQKDLLGLDTAPVDTTDGFFVYGDSTTKWHNPDNLPRGGFTQPILNNGDAMQYGEIKPLVAGGDVEYREVGGIRQTYNTDALTASLVLGQLSHLTTSTLLWPSSGNTPYFPFGPFNGPTYGTTTATRLVTVYDDDGSVLG